ncbi:aspartate aminotransferase family protein [Sphingomonas canadensis]|uniref:Aspartate aminotransferase family protein n=1 Tax=Sphingomonas canadensis TaxID=1219257 RepID=A0ABW3H8X4_9SPHN|nr:aspartate aminotransferase family protein [Sphingomonas canadensis]MCW3837653.1 aspartate aminotransferase family protein [Sphingomonas canadensis]
MSDTLMAVYNRPSLTFERGEGSWLYTADGTAYLDCMAGIATNALGHCHPALVAALTAQANRIWHLSNVLRVPGQEVLADKLTAACFADTVFFANSGTEAVECALKTARRYHAHRGNPERIDVIGFAGSFHGRTYGAMNAAGNPAYTDGFGPRLPGYVQCRIDALEDIRSAIFAPTAAALIVEPVQGEGGARALDGHWLRQIREWCSQAGVLLIHDEIQSGMGRTGRLFAHQWFEGCAPDIMTVAKALGGGFPVGACLATRAASEAMTFGSHGSTFGGNPLAMAVANAAFDLIRDAALMPHVLRIAARLSEGLDDIARRYPDVVSDVRGKGLLIGVRMVVNNREFMGLARDQRLLVAGGGENCVRLLPPLNLSAAEAAEALTRFEAACRAARAALPQAA